jgi:hypothetical protein
MSTFTHEPVNRNLNTLCCKHCSRVWSFDDSKTWSESCLNRERDELRSQVARLEGELAQARKDTERARII